VEKTTYVRGLFGLASVLAAGGPAIREIAIDRFGTIANRSADAGPAFFKEWKPSSVLELEKSAARHGELVQKLLDGIATALMTHRCPHRLVVSVGAHRIGNLQPLQLLAIKSLMCNVPVVCQRQAYSRQDCEPSQHPETQQQHGPSGEVRFSSAWRSRRGRRPFAIRTSNP